MPSQHDKRAKSSVQCNSSARSVFARMTFSRTNLKAFFPAAVFFRAWWRTPPLHVNCHNFEDRAELINYLFIFISSLYGIYLIISSFHRLDHFMLGMRMMMMPHESSYLPSFDRFSISNKIIPHFRAFFLDTLKLLLNFIFLRCPICGSHHRAAHKALLRLHSLVINENWISTAEEGDE